MRVPTYDDVPGLWLVDGSWRDVYVFDTAILGWSKLLRYATSYPYSFSTAGERRSIPSPASIFSGQDQGRVLGIRIGEVDAHCHFFSETEIELDIDPSQVTGPDPHLLVMMFLNGLATAIAKRVVVTLEIDPERPILSYDPSSETWWTSWDA